MVRELLSFLSQSPISCRELNKNNYESRHCNVAFLYVDTIYKRVNGKVKRK